MLLCPYVVGQAPVLSPQSRHTSRSTGQIACPLKGDRPLAGLQSAVLTRPVLKIPLNKPKLLYVGVQAAVKELSADGICSRKATLMAGAPCPLPAISKPDAHFEAMGLEFVSGPEELSISDLNDLFSRVGFPTRNPDKLVRALHFTHALMWIRATRKSRMARSGQLLGFARATSDGALSATIWDVAVHPAWQRSGLGRGVVERLTAGLVQEGIANITLFAEPNVVGLYEKLGFVRDPVGVKGLAFSGKLPRLAAPVFLM